MYTLNESMFLMAGAFDILPDAILVINEEGKIINSNKQVEAIFGYKSDEINGKSMDILLPAMIKSHHGNLIKEFFKNPRIRKMGAAVALSGVHKTKGEISIDVALSTINIGGEKYAISVIRDISDRVKLVSRINHIERVNAELEQFSYVLTHDLKAPLHRIKVLTEMIILEHSERESKEIKTITGILNESVGSMERLISGILEYNKAKFRKNIPESLIDLNEIHKQCLSLIDVPDRFLIRVINPLPVVRGNDVVLLQIFMNLIDNSIIHSGKPDGVLEIDWERFEDRVEISFSDNGEILPEETWDRLFDLSTQIGRRGPNDSYGFGLSIVKQLVENRPGCKIWYEPSHMNGSRFVIRWMN